MKEAALHAGIPYIDHQIMPIVSHHCIILLSLAPFRNDLMVDKDGDDNLVP